MPAMLTGACVTRRVMTRDRPRSWLGRSCQYPTRPGPVPGRGSRGRVEFELVEIAEGRTAPADARGVAAEVVVGELADRPLDAEVGQVQILLIDDRRDARVDLVHMLADQLDVVEVLYPEL